MRKSSDFIQRRKNDKRASNQETLVGVVAKPAGRIVSGEILFKGEDILKNDPKEVQKIRGNQIAFIPQDPTTALNPLFRIGFQIGEAAKYHRHQKVEAVSEEIVNVMKVVNIPSPEMRVKDYPHQLSGGLKQRVIIATALSCQPDLLIADEPTIHCKQLTCYGRSCNPSHSSKTRLG